MFVRHDKLNLILPDAAASALVRRRDLDSAQPYRERDVRHVLAQTRAGGVASAHWAQFRSPDGNKTPALPNLDHTPDIDVLLQENLRAAF
jgi:hypothetical protein